jgi:hypothetical protein
MFKLLWPTASLRRLGPVLIPMLLACDAGQVADVVVSRVAVNVVNVHPRRDWPVVVLPDVAVKPVPRPRKVSAMRRVIALRITVVPATVEDNRLNSNAT